MVSWTRRGRGRARSSGHSPPRAPCRRAPAGRSRARARRRSRPPDHGARRGEGRGAARHARGAVGIGCQRSPTRYTTPPRRDSGRRAPARRVATTGRWGPGGSPPGRRHPRQRRHGRRPPSTPPCFVRLAASSRHASRPADPQSTPISPFKSLFRNSNRTPAATEPLRPAQRGSGRMGVALGGVSRVGGDMVTARAHATRHLAVVRKRLATSLPRRRETGNKYQPLTCRRHPNNATYTRSPIRIGRLFFLYVLDRRLLALLREAITTCRMVEFHYLARSTGRQSRQCVQPYGLLYGNRAFLVARSDWTDEPRLWRLANVSEARLTAETFQRDPAVRPAELRQTLVRHVSGEARPSGPAIRRPSGAGCFGVPLPSGSSH